MNSVSSINSNNVPVSSISNSVSLTSSGNPSVPSAPSPLANVLGSSSLLGSSSITQGINSVQNNGRPDLPLVMNGPHSAGSHFILKVCSVTMIVFHLFFMTYGFKLTELFDILFYI